MKRSTNIDKLECDKDYNLRVQIPIIINYLIFDNER